MIALTVKLVNAGDIPGESITRIENIYSEALTAAVKNMQLLKAIHDDDRSGADLDIDHFDSGGSAWRMLKDIAHEAAAQSESFSDLAYFEVDFT